MLTTTKNKETEYKKILAERQAEKERFERELFQFESQLKFILDPNQIPKSGKIFGTPLDDVSITQRFGDTDFARSGAYNGKGHNGLDFRASVGTPIKSSLSGEVVSAIDNENVYGCGYGRWVMIRHDNGLNTLYAHLSVISVSRVSWFKQVKLLVIAVKPGMRLGHICILDSSFLEAVKITTFRCKNGKTVTTPAAAFNAYLDPMLYF